MFNNGWFEEVKGSIDIDRIQEKIKDKSQWYIFRCDFINQVINTETGLKPANSIRNRFLQWSRLIQGNESIFLTVKDGTRLEKHDEGPLKCWYDVIYSKEDVKFFKGVKTSDFGSTAFGSTSLGGFGDFANIYDDKNFEITSLEKITAQHLTEFYLIPNLTFVNESGDMNDYDPNFDDNDVFYISSYTNHYDPNSGIFVYSTISFSNIKFQLSSSGQTIEQHILFGSPGQGYLIPNLIFDSNGKVVDWEINKDYIVDRGTKAIQIEATGNYGEAGVRVYGIPVDDEHNSLEDKRWYAPRFLGYQQFLLPQTENNFKVKPKDNCVIYTNFKLVAAANYKAWQAAKSDMFGDTKTNYNGIIETKNKGTNETNEDNKLINDEDLGIWPDNEIFENMKALNVEPNILFRDGLRGPKTIDLTKIYKRVNGVRISFVDLFNTISYATLHINQMPIETNLKITQDVRNIQGFGRFANNFTLGLTSPWRRIYKRSAVIFPEFNEIPMMMGKNFYDFTSNSVFATNQLNPNNTRLWYEPSSWINQAEAGIGKLPLEFYQKEDSSILGALYGNNSISTALMLVLTDKSYMNWYNKSGTKGNIDPIPVSNVMVNEDPQLTDNKERAFKLDEDFRYINNNEEISNLLTDVNGNKYIITYIGFVGIGDGDARITTYIENPDLVSDENRLNNQNFQTFLQTQAQFGNGNLVDWNTDLTTSYLDALSNFQDNQFSWPQSNLYNYPEGAQAMDGTTTWKQGTSDIGTIGISMFASKDTPMIKFNDYDFVEPELVKIKSFAKKDLVDFKDLGYSKWEDIEKDYTNIRIQIPPEFGFYHIRGTIMGSNPTGNWRTEQNTGTVFVDIKRTGLWNNGEFITNTIAEMRNKGYENIILTKSVDDSLNFYDNIETINLWMELRFEFTDDLKIKIWFSFIGAFGPMKKNSRIVGGPSGTTLTSRHMFVWTNNDRVFNIDPKKTVLFESTKIGETTKILSQLQNAYFEDLNVKWTIFRNNETTNKLVDFDRRQLEVAYNL